MYQASPAADCTGLRGTTPTKHGLLSMLGHLVAQRTEHKERKALGRLWGPRSFSQEDEVR